MPGVMSKPAGGRTSVLRWLLRVFAGSVTAVLAVVISIYVEQRWKYGRALGAFAEEPRRLIEGHIHLMPPDRRDHMVRFLKHATEFRQHRVSQFWIGPIATVDVWDPEIVRQIFSSKTHNSKARMVYKALDLWLGTGLLLSSGPKWESRRRLITPAFHYEILRTYYDVMQECTATFISLLSDQASSSSDGFDIFAYVTRLTLDIIGESAMGVRLGAQRFGQESAEYVKSISSVAKAVNDRSLNPLMLFDTVFLHTPAGVQFTKDLKVLHTFTRNMINARRQLLSSSPSSSSSSSSSSPISSSRPRVAFLDLLLQSRDESSGLPLSDSDIQEEVDTFLFEGHDTTSAGIAWAIHLVGKHRDVQERLREEIDGLYDRLGQDARPAVADIGELKYLECVLKESNRLYPPVPIIARQLGEDLVIDGLGTLPKGLTTTIFIAGLHRHSDHWDRPDEFLPDRFATDGEESAKRHPYAYVPFSAGPRNCIGQAFAKNEEKVVLAALIRHFEIESLVADPPVVMEVITRPDDGIRVKLTKRIH